MQVLINNVAKIMDVDKIVQTMEEAKTVSLTFDVIELLDKITQLQTEVTKLHNQLNSPDTRDLADSSMQTAFRKANFGLTSLHDVMTRYGLFKGEPRQKFSYEDYARFIEVHLKKLLVLDSVISDICQVLTGSADCKIVQTDDRRVLIRTADGQFLLDLIRQLKGLPSEQPPDQLEISPVVNKKPRGRKRTPPGQ